MVTDLEDTIRAEIARGGDVHTRIAALMFRGVRDRAKTWLFAYLYGAAPRILNRLRDKER